MNSKNNPWTTLKSTLKYDNPWIEVVEHDVINPGGGKGIYGKVHFKNQAVGVIPIDDEGNTWLVGQHRYTLDEFSWEMPEGGAPYGEDVLEAAKRELKEETGLTASSFELILTMHNSNSVTDEIAYVFLATGLTHGEAELEESESDMVVKKLPFSEALDMVMKGKITDSMTVAGFLKASIILNS
ncbi:NUDIX domain-containing protein [Fulvivirga lutimaris]|uniref:NUDIX domain-containing protein n=1 Tax=Fulvivirga lutimaris TaxID=1819566 RepID=UPI0012BBD214|nr:NUDIX hydrolase [Fulvivirga lutimaris]MTI40533.1 NUDIX hydrolase [Fulvivirga lutimaris]